MPYVIQTRETNETMPEFGTFDDRRSAHAAIPAEFKSTLTAVYLGTDSDRAVWTERERSRFRDGTYREVPWSAHDTEHAHFAHLSIHHPGMVAYTPDDEHGYQDRQVRTNPGRYLEKYYSHIDRAIRHDWIKLATIDQSLQLTSNPSEIVEIYKNADGCTSCMDGRHRFPYGHPVQVYGMPGDLACAYYGPIDKPTARSIVWPEKKRYNRVYGDDRLETLLRESGYTRGSLAGAKIRAIECSEGWIMPYVDGIDCAEYLGDGLIRLGDGDIPTSETCGYSAESRSESDCEHCGCSYYDDDLTDGLCESCYDMRRSCEHCDRQYFADDDDTGYCRSCEADRNYCEVCEADYFGGDGNFSVERNCYVCDDCASSHDESRFACEHCETRVNEWELTRDEQRDRIDDGTALRFCLDCADLVITCHACAAVYEHGDTYGPCPSCGVPARCAHTLDLFSTHDMSAIDVHEAIAS